jgi:lysine-N-methylase
LAPILLNSQSICANTTKQGEGMPITHLTPRYYRQFACIGSDCEDNCCHGWSISIDKQSLRNYLGHSDPSLKKLAETHIRKIRKSDAQWGEIKLDEQGSCPFLDQAGLCVIHAKAGSSALSKTCQSYPRSSYHQEQEIRHTLTLSCPEVVRCVLLDPCAMEIELEQKRGHNTANPLPPTHNQLQQLALHIMLNRDLPAEQRIWIIGMLIHRDPKQLSHESFLNQLASIADTEGLTPHFEQLPYLPDLHWWGLRAMSNLLRSEQSSKKRGYLAMEQCMERVYRHFEGECDKEKVTSLYHEWQKKWEPWLAKHPHVLNNYLIYWLYHHGFPQKDRTPAEAYLLLVADFFLLRAYLCLLTIEGEFPDEKMIVSLFYSYHARRLHSRDFTRILHESLSASGLNSDISLYALLRNKE